MKTFIRRHWLAFALLIASAGVAAQGAAPASAPVRLRGTIDRVDGPRITIKERSGELVTVVLADALTFQEVLPVDIAAIQPGAFIGTAAVPRTDGQLQSLEVVVFPESARGTGEGHSSWDLQPQSTMTNATVTQLERSAQGRELTLRYKDGTKQIVVPEGVPIVTFKAGDRELIKPGAKVFAVVVQRDGQATATRLVVGRDGFAPPM
jgi:hypothetical protein